METQTNGCNFDRMFNVILLGDAGVGKGKLGLCLSRNYPFSRTFIKVDDIIIRVEIKEHRGNFTYAYDRLSRFYARANGALVVYDVTRADTFQHVEKWIKEYRENTDVDDGVIMLVGNKTDKHTLRAVPAEDAKAFAEREKILYSETSAFDSISVDKAFNEFVMQIYRNFEEMMHILFQKTRASKYDFKVLMLGDSGVGKSSLCSRLTKNEFSQECDPSIYTDNFDIFHRLSVDDKIARVRLMDIPKTEFDERRSEGENEYIYEGAAGAFVVYDVTRRETFENVEMLLKELRQCKNEQGLPIIMLVGNKADQKHLRVVSTEEAKAYAEMENMLVMETSALDAMNVEEAFTKLIMKICDYANKNRRFTIIDQYF